jgi:hypothetical protein
MAVAESLFAAVREEFSLQCCCRSDVELRPRPLRDPGVDRWRDRLPAFDTTPR